MPYGCAVADVSALTDFFQVGAGVGGSIGVFVGLAWPAPSDDYVQVLKNAGAAAGAFAGFGTVVSLFAWIGAQAGSTL